jgi:hypothetical protein
MKLKWVIQNNLINKGDSESIRSACVKSGYLYSFIEVVPFTQELVAIKLFFGVV